MDLLTQGILGAAVGQAGFQRVLGKKALAYGAIIGMIPDADVFVRFSQDICAEMLYHRGFTHSLFFAPIMGWICNYLYKKQQLTSWVGLWFWSLITHPLLDVFTVYGTQLLAPFSNHRFSFCAVPIIDPAYSVPLLVSVVIGCFINKRVWVSQVIASSILLLTSAYLFWGVAIRDQAINFVNHQEQIVAKKTEAFTTMFSIFHRRIVIEETDQFRVGFLNMLHPKPIKWHVLKKDKITDEILTKREVRIFYWFTDGWAVATTQDDSLLISDLRFGLDNQNLNGYWGIKVAPKKITWERFPVDLSFAKAKAFWNAIFSCH